MSTARGFSGLDLSAARVSWGVRCRLTRLVGRRVYFAGRKVSFAGRELSLVGCKVSTDSGLVGRQVSAKLRDEVAKCTAKQMAMEQAPPSLSHTHTRSLSVFLSHTLSHFLSPPLPLIHTHKHTRPLSVSLSLANTCFSCFRKRIAFLTVVWWSRTL